jgi:uncharacterized protein (TIGR03000 family)
MYTTLCCLLLASSELAVGQCGFGQGCEWDDGYGRYGTWGGYGGYAPRTFMPPYGTGMCLPPCVLGAAPYAAGGGPYAVGAADNHPQDKQLAAIKDALNAYQDKLKTLERKFEESDKLADLQGKQFELFEKKLAENQAKILITIQDFQTKALESRGPDSVADQLKALNERIEKLATARPDNSAVVALERHIELLEKLLKDSGNQKLADGIIAIGTALDNLKTSKTETPPPPTPPNPEDKRALPFNRALVIVNLPADARLFLDGLESTGGANVRTFISPELELGKSYFYTLRVELERNGKIYTETQKIYFQPGREARVSFNHLEPSAPVISNKKND